MVTNPTKKVRRRKIKREAQSNLKVVNQTKETTKVSHQYLHRLLQHSPYKQTSINSTVQLMVLSKFSNSYRHLRTPKNGRETTTA
jgi:hypothetical protein